MCVCVSGMKHRVHVTLCIKQGLSPLGLLSLTDSPGIKPLIGLQRPGRAEPGEPSSRFPGVSHLVNLNFLCRDKALKDKTSVLVVRVDVCMCVCM